MKMDEYYRQKAIETRPVHRDLRTAIPNGEAFSSRGMGLHMAAQRISTDSWAMPQEFRDRETRKLSCPDCQAAPGEPCVSQDKRFMGKELAGFHAARSIAAAKNYRKKS